MATSTRLDRQSAVGRRAGVFRVEHPLIQHHLSQLRDVSTGPAEFRLLVQRLATLLAYEATKGLRVEHREVTTPLSKATGHRLTQRIGVVPILRAGLGMVDPVLALIPHAEVWHLGLYRDEKTAEPVRYYDKLPSRNPVDLALVVDPMLATGGSVTAALLTLREWGVPEVKLLSILAAEEGLDLVASQFPEAEVYVCQIDPTLNDQKFIVPGLGDAGDRMFGTLDGNP